MLLIIIRFLYKIYILYVHFTMLHYLFKFEFKNFKYQSLLINCDYPFTHSGPFTRSGWNCRNRKVLLHCVGYLWHRQTYHNRFSQCYIRFWVAFSNSRSVLSHDYIPTRMGLSYYSRAIFLLSTYIKLDPLSTESRAPLRCHISIPRTKVVYCSP